MARNGSGVFSLPSGSIVAPNDDVLATQHNTPIQDIEADLNLARPVVAGGTGATTAGDARTNLGADSKVLAKSSTYNLALADRSRFVRCTATLTLNLLAAASAGDGYYFTVLADGGNVTIDPNSSELVDGAATLAVNDGETVKLWCNGSEWRSNKANTPTLTSLTVTGAMTGIAGRIHASQSFDTAGAHTYTPTTGTKYAVVYLTAAGAGGGCADSDSSGEIGIASGGSAGATRIALIDVSGIGTATVTIGAGGPGSTTAGGNGADGGDSTWSDGTTSLTVSGGKGGKGDQDRTNSRVIDGQNGGANNGATTAGANLVADIGHFSGNESGVGFGISGGDSSGAGAVFGGSGGASFWGGGIRSVINNLDGNSSDGVSATTAGAGGGGGCTIGAVTKANGGDGADGYCRILEYTA